MGKTIKFQLTDTKTGKSLGEFSWPVSPFTKIDESNLTEEQKTKLKDLIKEQIKMAKGHFNDGAWDLDASFLLHQVVDDFFGFSLTDLFLTQMCYKAKVGYTFKDSKSVYRNYTDKVFYNPQRNKVYIATTAKDVDSDIQLGDL